MKPLKLLLLGLLALPVLAEPLPPINEPATTEAHPGKFIWADLFTSDQTAATTFYIGLFHWTATTIERQPKTNPQPYVVLSHNGRPIAGIGLYPRQLPAQAHGRWVGYVSVADAPAALTAATAAGGHVLFPARNLVKRGIQAIFIDPQGGMLGLLRSSTGDPGDYRPEAGDWAWAQHFARDPAAAALFYHTVLGYEVLPDERTNRPNTFLFSSGGFARASLAPLPNRPNAKPGWLLFVRVANIQESAELAATLGGRILVAPKQVDQGTQLAIVADAVGAAIGLVELAEPAETQEQP